MRKAYFWLLFSLCEQEIRCPSQTVFVTVLKYNLKQSNKFIDVYLLTCNQQKCSYFALKLHAVWERRVNLIRIDLFALDSVTT